MRKLVGGLCILIVGLQILVGVPLAVCVAFFSCLQSPPAPLAVEFVPGARITQPVALTPPPNAIPAPLPPRPENPFLAWRQEQGSPLAGTVLAADSSPA